MNKPWNMARARAASYRTPRKHKPLVVGPDAQTVALLRGASGTKRCCGRHVCSCKPRHYEQLKSALKEQRMLILGIDEADVQPTREAIDRATSMPADTPEAKAYWLIDRIEMWLRSDHAVEYDAEHNSIMLRNEPDTGNSWAMPVEDFDGLTDEQLNRYLDKCCQSLREINRDTLPPGWENIGSVNPSEEPEQERILHTATGAVVWRWSPRQRWGYGVRPPGDGMLGASCAGYLEGRNEAMDAALALVPVGAEREGWEDGRQSILYLGKDDKRVYKLDGGEWRWAYSKTFAPGRAGLLAAQLAVEAAHREQSR